VRRRCESGRRRWTGNMASRATESETLRVWLRDLQHGHPRAVDPQPPRRVDQPQHHRLAARAAQDDAHGMSVLEKLTKECPVPAPLAERRRVSHLTRKN